jgi:hypothetical protein
MQKISFTILPLTARSTISKTNSYLKVFIVSEYRIFKRYKSQKVPRPKINKARFPYKANKENKYKDKMKSMSKMTMISKILKMRQQQLQEKTTKTKIAHSDSS